MSEGPTPRQPRDEPPRDPVGGPEAPVEQPPPSYPPADNPPGAHEAPRWESPGAPPPPPPQGGTGSLDPEPHRPPQGGTGTWDPGPASTPPPPPPPPAGQDWGQPSWSQQQGGYPSQPAAGGMAANVASGLAYAFTWLTGLIFFLVDRRPEVRFHAVQSIAFGVLWTLVAVIRRFMPFPIDALLGVAWWVFLVTWVVLLIQGFQGKHFKLPVIGDFAEQQAGRPGP